MCGLAGIVAFGENSEDSFAKHFADVNLMLHHLLHRGPDAGAVERLGRATFGHRRLSIIDLSERANQPLYNEDQSIFLVCNGEIYNHRELRKTLEAQGHEFRSGSDSEVVIHGYEQSGLDFLSQLNGMFALAIFDHRNETLILARDRLGQKPLYYRLCDNRLAFASEFFALHKVNHGPCSINSGAIKRFLALGYIPAPETAINQSFELEPATVLSCDSSSRVKKWTYWQPSTQPKLTLSAGETDEQLRKLLQSSIARRLKADVPLGCFLSGGLDSSSILASVASISEGQLAGFQCFTTGFNEEAFDESKLAARVAEHFGARHRVQQTEVSGLELLPKLTRLFGEPFADSSALPCYRIAKFAREQVTVVLSGDGADEIFGGISASFCEFVESESWVCVKAAAEIPRKPGKALLACVARQSRASFTSSSLPAILDTAPSEFRFETSRRLVSAFIRRALKPAHES